MDYTNIHFRDPEILGFLDDADESDIAIVDGFFRQLLSLYESNPDGVTWESLLINEWNVLEDGDSVNEIFRQLGLGQTKDDKVWYIFDVRESLTAWEKIKEIVRTEKRYFCDTTPISSFISDDVSVSLDKIETKFFRARVHKTDEPQFQPDEMGCPKDVSKITPGRANPKGIPYLYLCLDRVTPFYEVRPAYLDRVDVGEFQLRKDNVKLVDFTQEIQIFSLYADVGETAFVDVVRRKLLFNAISNDLSKPLRSYDTDLEYIPTQLVCEYCKVQGYDGIIFNSSQWKGGKNVVLFAPEYAECVSVRPYEITQIDIETNPRL